MLWNVFENIVRSVNKPFALLMFENGCFEKAQQFHHPWDLREVQQSLVWSAEMRSILENSSACNFQIHCLY